MLSRYATSPTLVDKHRRTNGSNLSDRRQRMPGPRGLNQGATDQGFQALLFPKVMASGLGWRREGHGYSVPSFHAVC